MTFSTLFDCYRRKLLSLDQQVMTFRYFWAHARARWTFGPMRAVTLKGVLEKDLKNLFSRSTTHL